MATEIRGLQNLNNVKWKVLCKGQGSSAIPATYINRSLQWSARRYRYHMVCFMKTALA